MTFRRCNSIHSAHFDFKSPTRTNQCTQFIKYHKSSVYMNSATCFARVLGHKTLPYMRHVNTRQRDLIIWIENFDTKCFHSCNYIQYEQRPNNILYPITSQNHIFYTVKLNVSGDRPRWSKRFGVD